MTKKRNSALLMLIVATSLCTGKIHAGNHDGFVAGACAVGAAILGAAGAVALADWCCSETDTQLLNRVQNQYASLKGEYQQTMDYFASRAGIGINAPNRPLQLISEAVLYEFASFVWNSNVSQSSYRSDVWSAHGQLQRSINDLTKRIDYLQRKGSSYEDHRNLNAMRSLLMNVQQLKADIALFAECLETHKAYFSLYDSVGKFENQYRAEVSLLTSGSYNYATDVKHYILGHNSGKYPFRSFVKEIERTITILQSDIRYLAYNYEAGRSYANDLLQRMADIKTIVVSDPRYQQELYAYEQERLEQEHLALMRQHERLERERRDMERQQLDALRRQNRILEERNRIERQKACIVDQPQLIVNIEI